MTNKQEPLVVAIGQVGAPYGVRGLVKINSFTEPPENVVRLTPWLIQQDGQWQTVTVEDLKPHGDKYVARLNACSSPEEAQHYTQQLIGIERHYLPALDKKHYYWADLIGLTVVNKDNMTLGTLDYMMETGSNDVMVVKGAKESVIPFIMDDVVLTVDLPRGVITVDWDETF